MHRQSWVCAVQTPSPGQIMYFIAKRKIYEAYIRAFHFETSDLLNHYTFSFGEICLCLMKNVTFWLFSAFGWLNRWLWWDVKAKNSKPWIWNINWKSRKECSCRSVRCPSAGSGARWAWRRSRLINRPEPSLPGKKTRVFPFVFTPETLCCISEKAQSFAFQWTLVFLSKQRKAKACQRQARFLTGFLFALK